MANNYTYQTQKPIDTRAVEVLENITIRRIPFEAEESYESRVRVVHAAQEAKHRRQERDKTGRPVTGLIVWEMDKARVIVRAHGKR